MPQQPLVIVTEPMDPIPMDWLRARAHVLELSHTDPQFLTHLPRAQGLIVRTYTRVDEPLLARATNLKVVGRGGVGLENVDVAACRKKGVQVVFTPDANTIAVADFVFFNILRHVRPWTQFAQTAPTPEEFKKIRNDIRGTQLNELTLGILGMGRVGKTVGRIASLGFNMTVLYNDAADVSSSIHFPATPVSKDDLFIKSDVLSIHVDMHPGNENLVNARLLSLMKPSAILLNTSRGEVLDTHALADAIKSQKLAGASIDVFAPEPPPADLPLLNLPNVLLTPHVAARTTTAMENMSWVVKDIMRVIDGNPPQYPAPQPPTTPK